MKKVIIIAGPTASETGLALPIGVLMALLSAT